MTRIVDRWSEDLAQRGPYRVAPTGDLYVYAWPDQAEPGEPAGIYVPADDAVKRYLAAAYGEEWTQSRRNEVLQYLKDLSPPTFNEVNAPLIPVLNGVLDLTDPFHPQLQEHSPLYGFTSQIPHAYRPDARAPAFTQFLQEAAPEDAYGLVYELFGYTMLPYQFLRKAVMVTGPSGTGKSTLLFVLERLIGQNNTAYVPLQALGGDRFAASDLYGRLANIGGDIDSNAVENTGMFKSLTGDDYVRADVKYGKPVRFRSGATCWFAANEPPASTDHTDAWRNRWVILPFDRKPDRPDWNLKDRLTQESEMEGILRYAVSAVTQVIQRGDLSEPKSIKDAHTLFASSTDHIQEFLQGLRAGQQAGHFIPRPDLWAQYKAWTFDENVRAVRKSVLNTRAKEQFPMTIRAGAHGYLISPEED